MARSKRLTITGFILALLAAGCSTAKADFLILYNGDRITGNVIEASDSGLTFRTESIGSTLTIPWPQISGLQTDDRMHVALKDGTEIIGHAEIGEPGKIRLSSAELDQSVSFAISAIQSITGPRTPVRKSVLTSGNFNLGGSLTRGNTKTEATIAAAQFEARSSINRFRFDATYNRVRDDGRLSRDNSQSNARYDHFVSERIYLNSNASLSRDRFKDLRLRSTAGVGMGYQFLDTAQRSLSVEVGGSYVSQDYYVEDNESNPAARWAIDFERRLTDGIQLFHVQQGLINLQDKNELLLISSTGLRFPVLAQITGTLQLNIDYDNAPPRENSRTDFALLVTIGYKW